MVSTHSQYRGYYPCGCSLFFFLFFPPLSLQLTQPKTEEKQSGQFSLFVMHARNGDHTGGRDVIQYTLDNQALSVLDVAFKEDGDVQILKS